VRVAVLVSGTGSILTAMLDAGVPVALVVADRPCPGLGLAADRDIPAELVERASFAPDFDRDDYCARLARELGRHGIDLVVMAGFGTILSQPMHDAFPERILNTHPALLPSFKGWHAVRDALDYGVKVSGCTVHVAGLDVDTGPILAQAAVPVLPEDTESSLHERIKDVERRLYPETVLAILERGTVLP
jgi:phosphoribosylglycinamide formyltransferase-1